MRTSRPIFLTNRARTLRGTHVQLRPISRRDAVELALVPDDGAWELLLRKPAEPGAAPSAWLDDALRTVKRGTERCWTIRDRVTGQLLGSTRFLNVDLANRRVEIGATWLLPEARGSVANAESKLLLLDHAFDVLGMQRVHIQADVRNTTSRAAIEALGASLEGVLRHHIVLADGTSRDTAVYSIIAPEWPALRATLVARVEAKVPSWRARESSLVEVEPAALTALTAQGANEWINAGVTYSSTTDAIASTGSASAVA
ncbi:MAG: GNAT family N-acetyltransferase [Thermoleophilia bacterium]|nr:GNAT family N-acetyltransferase [Thermoleophilia bacterium]